MSSKFYKVKKIDRNAKHIQIETSALVRTIKVDLNEVLKDEPR